MINFAYLENDDEYGDDRYLYKIDDDRTLYDTLTLNASGLVGSVIDSDLSYSRVSDRDYFNDFGNSLSKATIIRVSLGINLSGVIF